MRGSLTFARPENPEALSPGIRRAHTPSVSKFASPEVLTVSRLVKLARAIDLWSGSIAVHVAAQNQVVGWGVIDQLVEQNIMFQRETDTGAENPGVLTITMDGIGEVSAYHGSIFLGGIRAQNLVVRESDAFQSKALIGYGSAALASYAPRIASVFKPPALNSHKKILERLVDTWTNALCRLCIGLRRFGTGGAFLLTPRPKKRRLNIGHPFDYSRLRDAGILHVLDEGYKHDLEGRWQSQVYYSPAVESLVAD